MLNATAVSAEFGIYQNSLKMYVVRWRMFDRTVQVVKERNQDISSEMLAAMIDDTVREVRAERQLINSG